MPTLTKKGSSTEASGHFLANAGRVSELIGFLLVVAGLLSLLSLISYFPQDPSLDAAGGAAGSVHNWIGPVGSYSADALNQMFGWVAYLLPLVLFLAGFKLIRTQHIEYPRTKLFGLLLLITSLAALLEIFPFTPLIHGVIRGSGLVGYLAAAGLRSEEH